MTKAEAMQLCQEHFDKLVNSNACHDLFTALIAKEYVRKEDVKEQTWRQDKIDKAVKKQRSVWICFEHGIQNCKECREFNKRSKELRGNGMEDITAYENPTKSKEIG